MPGEKITATQLLFPVALLSLVLMVFLAFQTSLLVNDHGSLQQARAQQDQPLEQAAKVKDQANALAVGTLKLAEGGNKDAQNIIGQLKKLGITVQDQPSAAQAAPAAPAAPAPPATAP